LFFTVIYVQNHVLKAFWLLLATEKAFLGKEKRILLEIATVIIQKETSVRDRDVK